MIGAALLVVCVLGGALLLSRPPQVGRLARLSRRSGGAVAGSSRRAVRDGRRVPAGTSPVDDLAFDLDLAAVCLQAGLPVDRALDHAVRASGDRSGLAHIARSARLGVEGETAEERTRLSSVVAVIRFSGRTGVALAPLLQAHADELRRTEHRRRQIAAARLGVMLVMPLGVCVLPAFVLLGVVPVLLTLLGDLAPALTGL